MEKEIFRIDVSDEIIFDADAWGKADSNIDDVIKIFQDAKDNGAKYVSWVAVSHWSGESESCNAQCYYEVEESEEDFKKRQELETDKIKKELEEKERKEKNQYEKLKMKFG